MTVPKNVAPGVKGFVARSIVERFWEKVDRRNPDECWPWLGSKGRRGYGLIYHNGKCRRASQVAWEIQNGRPFPEDNVACHSCDNPTCTNPAHIWAGTMSQNTRDAISKGRLDVTKMHAINHNREKMVCPKGHPLAGENLILRKEGWRVCRECKRLDGQARPNRKTARAALGGAG